VSSIDSAGWLRVYVLVLAAVGMIANGLALATRALGLLSVLNVAGLLLAVALFRVAARLPDIAATDPRRVRGVLVGTAALALVNGAVGLVHHEFAGALLAGLGAAYMWFLVRWLGHFDSVDA